MGRGDKRTKRGKITMGSFGVSRKARTEKVAPATADTAEATARKAPSKKAAKPKKTEE